MKSKLTKLLLTCKPATKKQIEVLDPFGLNFRAYQTDLKNLIKHKIELITGTGAFIDVSSIIGNDRKVIFAVGEELIDGGILIECNPDEARRIETKRYSLRYEDGGKHLKNFCFFEIE